jgi:hypothetical protein
MEESGRFIVEMEECVMMREPGRELMDLGRFVEWLRGQRMNEEYIWQDPVKCLVGRYLAAHGSRWGEVAYSELPFYEEVAGVKPWTYGAALGRAEKFLALPAPVGGEVEGKELAVISRDVP